MRKLAEESIVVEYIKSIREGNHGLGGDKLWLKYNKFFGKEQSVGYNRFYDIIDKYSLKVRKRKRRVQTTDSDHSYPLHPNLIKDLIPTSPNELWVSDITYIPIRRRIKEECYDFCYLSLITDYYTKEIIGRSVGPTLEAKYPMKALNMALGRLDPKSTRRPIHHSDRGVQYACYAYTNRLQSMGIRISMTESGNPKDNAVAERVNNTIKNELLKGMVFYSIEEVIAAVDSAIDFYNNERPHMSLDGLTPAEAAKRTGEIKKNWISYREIAIKSKRV